MGHTTLTRCAPTDEHAEIINRMGWDLDSIEEYVAAITGQPALYRCLTPIMFDALICVDSNETRFILDGPHRIYSAHHKCGRCGANAGLHHNGELTAQQYRHIMEQYRMLNQRPGAALRRLGRRIAGCDHRLQPLT